MGFFSLLAVLVVVLVVLLLLMMKWVNQRCKGEFGVSDLLRLVQFSLLNLLSVINKPDLLNPQLCSGLHRRTSL